MTAGDIPADLPDVSRAVLQAVDAVVAQVDSRWVQDRMVAAYGNAGVVEVVVLCGLYAIMGYTVVADIPIEQGLPTPPDPLRCWGHRRRPDRPKLTRPPAGRPRGGCCRVCDVGRAAKPRRWNTMGGCSPCTWTSWIRRMTMV